MHTQRSLLGLLFTLGLFLTAAACETSVPASFVSTLTPAGSPTPDPCSPPNLPSTVKPENDLMRQFDDYATLAQNIVQSDLVKVIPPMQAIRRAAEDLVVPACLADLKRFELAYMDATLQTLLLYEKPNPNAAALVTGIAQARDYHDQYTLELARLLGVTLVAPTAAAPGGTTPAP